jgi:DNA-binding response OmpR family regulator
MSTVSQNITKHILIVDDEMHFRYGVTVALKQAGYKVSEAEDGSKALSMICKGTNGGQFDLIVLDIQMPRMMGNELYEVMRMNGIKVPVLFVTGYADSEIISRLKRMGNADILNKPFAPSELVARIDERFGKNEDSGSRKSS